MVSVYWTDEAKKWLKNIFEYIAEDNKIVAYEVINNIIHKAENIKEFPEIGQKLLDWPEENIRMILYGHYRIIYIIKSSKRIDILGVYHGALDLKKHLKKF